jgi:hypothetical protein
MNQSHYCICGASIGITTSSPSLGQEILAAFDSFHRGLGHSPTNRVQATRARRAARRAELKLIENGDSP